MNAFTTCDIILAGATLLTAVLGLLGGFSGALGFLAGLAAAGAVVHFARAPLFAYITETYLAILALAVGALLAFGLARIIIRRIVKGLLAQPADAIFGALVAAVTGLSATLGIYFLLDRILLWPIHSRVYTLVLGFVS